MYNVTIVGDISTYKSGIYYHFTDTANSKVCTIIYTKNMKLESYRLVPLFIHEYCEGVKVTNEF